MDLLRNGIRSALSGVGVVALLLYTNTAAVPQQSPVGSATLSMSDRAFILKAAEAGRAEVALGRLAQEKAVDAGVKDFGRRMIQDHGRATRELAALLAPKGMELADADGKPSGLPDRLSKLSGREFDRAYVRAMVKDHRHDVSQFRRMKDEADDPDLKTWVTKFLPTLEEHLRLVESLGNRVGASR